MVNRKNCYLALECSVEGSKTISLRVPKDFPLDGQSVKIFLEEYGKEEQSDRFLYVKKEILKYLKKKRNNKKGKKKNGSNRKGNG